MDFFTKAVAAGEAPAPPNAVAPPIFQTSAYAFHDVAEADALLAGQHAGYSYTRSGNPNFDAMAQLMADLEETEAAVVTASGTAALTAALLAMSPTPCRVLMPRVIYGGTVGLVRRLLEPLGYRLEWVDVHDVDALRGQLDGPPAVLAVESISNPLARVAPLDEVIQAAHAAGVAVMVDNTFATPFHAQPARWGADLVVHSLTKFIGGHSDLILGVVAGSGERVAKVRSVVRTGGFTPDPFAVWLALRGARTLALRMDRASANAALLARALEPLPGVVRVYHPSLESHPDYAVAQRLLQRGGGAIVAMILAGGYPAVEELVHRLKIVPFVPSLGDVSTTVSHPLPESRRDPSAAASRGEAHDEGLVRISVGIEAAVDIIGDFRQALAADGAKSHEGEGAR